MCMSLITFDLHSDNGLTTFYELPTALCMYTYLSGQVGLGLRKYLYVTRI